MSTYAIGDLQGCFSALIELLDRIAFSEQSDTLWFTGDLINRGPNSLETLEWVYQLSQKGCAKTVLGNHDLALLTVAFGGRKSLPSDTHQDILQAPHADELLNWLKQQPLIYTDASLGYTLVHAGIPPQWTLTDALRYGQEVKNQLQNSATAPEILSNLFGNTPDTWDKNLMGHARIRYITNALTRMRFCDASGTLNLSEKGTPDHPPSGLKPWFEWPSKSAQQTSILFGHWAALEGRCNVPNIHALDTGCVWGGCLTAFCLETKIVTQVQCPKNPKF